MKKEEYNERLIWYLSTFNTIDEATMFCERYIIVILESVIQNKGAINNMKNSNDTQQKKLESLHDVLVKEVMQYSEIDDMIEHLMNYVRGILEGVLEKKEQQIDEFYKQEKKNIDSKIKIRKKFRAVTNLKTIVGPIRYSRMKYEFTYSDNTTESYYILDELIGVVKNSKYSKEYIKRLVNQVVNQSYGKSSKQLKFFGSDISRQGIWNIIIDLIGPKLMDYEKRQTMEYLKGHESNSNLQKVSTLFIEMDGLFVPVKDPKDKREKGEPHRKKEMKLGKAYIGWAKRYKTENSSYKTTGTVYACGFEDVNTFRLLFAGKINEIYDYYGVKQIVVNGDGAKWIFNTFNEDRRVVLQLDLYHIYSNITANIKDKGLANECKDLVNNSKYNELINLVEKSYNKERKMDAKSGLRRLLTYFNNNFFYLRRHNEVDIIKANEALEVRTLGTMEGSIRNVLSYRLKINGVWSYTGAKIMGMLLCYYHENRLDDILDEILTDDYEDSYMGDLEKEIKAYYKQESLQSSAAYKSVSDLARIGTYSYPVNSTPSINLKKEIMKSPIIGEYLNWLYDPSKGGMSE